MYDRCYFFFECLSLPVKLFGPGDFFLGRFITRNSISLIDSGPLRVFFILGEFWQFVVFKELVHFTCVAKELFTVFPSHPLTVWGSVVTGPILF